MCSREEVGGGTMLNHSDLRRRGEFSRHVSMLAGGMGLWGGIGECSGEVGWLASNREMVWGIYT